MALPTYQASGTFTVATAASASPPWPVHAVNDVALLLVQSSNQTITLSDPQGFTEITALSLGTGTAGTAGALRLGVFWARATTTSMAAPTIANPGDHIISRISTFRGCRTFGNPFGVIGADVLVTPDTAVTIPSVTTVIPDCLIALVIANAIDSASSQVSNQTNANLGSLTERHDSNGSNGTGGGVCLTTGTFATPGTTGTTTALLAATSAQVRAAIALLPTLAPQTFAGGIIG